MPENLVMASAYERPFVQTMGVGVNKTQQGREGKDFPDIFVAFRFGANIINKENNGVAREKILVEISRVRLGTKFSETIF